MRIIHLPIEVKSRELIPKIFFASRAIKKNFACFIGDKIAVNRSVRFFKNGIYFHKSINKNDKNYIINIKSKVDGYISLDEEAGNAFTNDKELDVLLNYRSSEINVKNIDKIYNWGKFDFKVWRNKYSKYKKKFIITGLPRSDIWREKISTLIFKDEVKFLKKKYADFIFIPSTFISSKSKLIQLINFERKRIRDKKFKNKKIENRKYEYQLFIEFTNLISNLSKDYPKLNIVIKPHPSETSDDWINSTKNLKNVFIDDQFEITPYISASKFVIFNSSTAGMQSVFMKKKTICYRTISDKKSLRNFPNNFGIQCKSYNYLKKIIFKNFSYNQIKQMKLLNERLNISKKYSSDLILENINFEFKKLEKFKYKKTTFTLLSLYYKLKSKFRIDKLFNLFSKKKDINFPVRSMKKKLGSGILKEDIEKTFKKLKIKKYKLQSLGNNGFLIYR